MADVQELFAQSTPNSAPLTAKSPTLEVDGKMPYFISAETRHDHQQKQAATK
jgi:hypothetical protein